MAINGVSGTYKGLRFRSLLELRFMKFMEHHGIDLARDVVVEPEFKVRYYDGDTRRSYVVDYLVKPFNTVYEVKHSANLRDRVNVLKFAAAQEFFDKKGLRFCVFTEKLLDKYAPMIRVTMRRVKVDPNVVLSEASVTNFKRLRRRAKATKQKSGETKE